MIISFTSVHFIHSFIQTLLVYLPDQGQARACCPGCQEEHHIVPALWKPTIWWGEIKMLTPMVKIRAMFTHEEWGRVGLGTLTQRFMQIPMLKHSFPSPPCSGYNIH